MRLYSLCLAACFGLGAIALPVELVSPVQELQVNAQTLEERRAEGDRLLQQAEEQRLNYQSQPALETAQQALSVYRTIGDRQGEGKTLRTLGRIYQQLNDYETAIEYHQQALAIARETEDRDLEWRTLKNIGDTYISLGNPTEAVAQLELGLSIARELNDYQGEGLILTSLGNAFDDLKQNDRAIDYLQQGLAISREVSDRATEEYALRLLGHVYERLGNYAQAVEYFQQSLVVGGENDDPEAQAFSLISLQLAYSNLGDFSQAINANQQGLIFAQEIANPRLEIAFLASLSMLYRRIGELDNAIDAGLQRLTIAQGLQEPELEIDALRYLVVVHVEAGDYTQAAEHAQQYSAIAQRIADPVIEASGLQFFASTQNQLGNYPEAIEAHERAIVLAREAGNSELQFESLGFIGDIYLAGLSNYSRAIERYQQQLDLAREVQNSEWQIEALHRLGQAWSTLAIFLRPSADPATRSNAYEQAISCYEQALFTAQAIEDQQWEALTLDKLSEVYYQLENYDQAIEYADQSLSLLQQIDSPTDEIDVLITLASIYNALEDRRSIEYAQQAVALGDEVFLPGIKSVALGQLAIAHRVFEEYDSAIAAYQQSLTIARATQDSQSEGNALADLGTVLFESGDFVAAEAALYDAINIFESLRAGLGGDDENKVALFESQSAAYHTLQQVLIAQNKEEEALEVAEQGRARAFIDLLATRQADTTLAATPDISTIKSIAQQQNATLVQYSVINPLFGNPALYIWVVKPTGEVNFRSVDLTTLEQPLSNLVSASRKAIGVRSRSRTLTISLSPEAQQRQQTEQHQNLQQLHQLLIQPIQDLLPTSDEEPIILIPHGELFLVPFAALINAEGRYLIQDHTILTAPSIQVLQFTHPFQQRNSERRAFDADKVLVVGNPIMPSVWNPSTQMSEPLSGLPGAEAEAIEIASAFNTEALLGNQASESAVVQRMQSAQIIHLATHGLLEYGNPQESGVRDFPGAIALAPDDTNDGLLTSSEILDLNLSAELVVLSACDTGRGTLTSDGVIGLSRSLISAGVPSILVSLWAVDDNATSELMQEFYRRWRTAEQPLDKAQALRQAMLTTMQTYPDPKYWAAFTLIGER